MAVPAFGPQDRVGVVVALMDWTGIHPPEFGHLAGCAVLDQGKSRYEAITSTGGQVLGMRPLSLDALAPEEFNGAHIGAVHVVWGPLYIRDLAEQYFAS